MNEPSTDQTIHPVINEPDGDRRQRLIVIQFNDEPVRFQRGAELTGLEIKQTAISQGVDIELDYVLSVINHGGHGREVGDADVVKITERIEFCAIPGDDNS